MIGSSEIPALSETEEDFLSDFSEWTVIRLTDGEILAGAIRYRLKGEILEIGRLMIHPDYRRRGLAKKLLQEVGEKFPGREKLLYTCTRSWTNIRLYEQAGFSPVKTILEDSGLEFVYMSKEAEKDWSDC